MPDTYSVSEITTVVQRILEDDPLLRDIWVRGEISNMTVARSGHWYFTVKDDDARLECAMWRSYTYRQHFEPQEGDAVFVHGRIGVYPAQGKYQLYADQIQPVGSIGDLYRRFEELKVKLEAEGLFDLERKRPLPAFPARIGVVTSPDAAAFRDVQNVLRRRYPLGQIVLSPTLVQGPEAPAGIVRAITRLVSHQAADVILVVRGGGSIEDLWAFNDELVARTLAASPIPTVSGVGHETDFTIADFVADVRAPTPSAAAEQATPNQVDLLGNLHAADATLMRAASDALTARRDLVSSAQRTLGYVSPRVMMEHARQRVDDLELRLQRIRESYFDRLRERLEARTAALAAASPEAVLSRGYAIVSREADGQIITDPDQAPPGTALSIRLRGGTLPARAEADGKHEA